MSGSKLRPLAGKAMIGMPGRVGLMSLFVLLTMSTGHEACAAKTEGSLASDSILVQEAGGNMRPRDYKVWTPASLSQGNSPALVIVLHGGTGDADAAVTFEYEGLWNAKADARQFYVVYPQGRLQPGSSNKRNWNGCRAVATAFDAEGKATDGGINPSAPQYSDWDDVAFIDQLASRFINPPTGSGIVPVDPKRIFVAGLSNGGNMTQRIAREAPGKFKAFSTIVSLVPANDKCAEPDPRILQSNGRKMLFLYGGADILMPVQGGLVAGDVALGAVLSAATSVRKWSKWLGVRSIGAELAQPDRVPDDGPSRQFWRYYCSSVACPAGYPSRMTDPGIALFVVRVEGGGHTSPGMKQIGPIMRRYVGARNLDVVHVETMATFFGLQ